MKKIFLFFVFVLCNSETVTVTKNAQLSQSIFQSISTGIYDGSWQNASGASCDDGSTTTQTQVYALGHSEILKINNFGFNIPSEAQIEQVLINFNVKTLTLPPSNGFNDFYVSINNGTSQTYTTIISNSSWTENVQTIQYPISGQDLLWGTSWNANDINSPDFGISLQVVCGNTDTIGIVECSSISITYNVSLSGNVSKQNRLFYVYIGVGTGVSLLLILCACSLLIVYILRKKKKKDEQMQSQFDSVIFNYRQKNNSKRTNNDDDDENDKNVYNLDKPTDINRLKKDFENIQNQIELIHRTECVQENIVLISNVGKGKHGSVWHAKMAETTDVACKCSISEDINSIETSQLLSEITMMKNFKFRHQNVVTYYGTCMANFPLEYQPHFFMVMQYCENGSLKTLLKLNENKFGMNIQLKMAADIACGMDYISKKGIIHRDLAARNMLVTKTLSIKIADFGKAKIISEKDNNVFIDNPHSIWPRGMSGKNKNLSVTAIPVRWMAPEVLNFMQYTFKSDVWSFGILLWEIFTYGQDPWGNISDENVEKYIKEGSTLILPELISIQVKDLLKSLLSYKEHERPSFNSAWVTLNNIRSTYYPNETDITSLDDFKTLDENYNNMSKVQKYTYNEKCEIQDNVPSVIDEIVYNTLPTPKKETSHVFSFFDKKHK